MERSRRLTRLEDPTQPHAPEKLSLADEYWVYDCQRAALLLILPTAHRLKSDYPRYELSNAEHEEKPRSLRRPEALR
jgi:hypothetical protein